MMLAVVTVLMLLLFAAALGRRLLRMARLRLDSPLEEFVTSAALGFGVFSLLIMALGLLDLLRGPGAAAVLVILVAVLLPDAARLLIDGFRAGRLAPSSRFTGFEIFLLTAIAASLVFGFFSALAPPTSWDATVSHLKLPLLYLTRGSICRVDDLHSNGPLNAVMLYLPAFRFGGDAAPALLHLAFLVLAGLALYAFARPWMSRTGALAAAAAYFVMPISAVLGPEAHVDFPVVLYVMLAFIAFVRWCESERPAWLILAAVEIGLAVGTKYIGLHAAVLFVVGIAVQLIRKRDRASALLSHAAAAILVAAAVGCPWYVRNAVLTGNPVYPMLATLIPTRHISAYWTGGSRVSLTPRKYPADPLHVALFPVNYTFGFSRGIGVGPRPEGVLYTPGPLLLAFVPLLLILRHVPHPAKAAAWLALLACVLVIPMFPVPRYLLAFVTPACAVVGHVFDRLGGAVRARRVLALTIAAVLLLQLVPFAARAATRFNVVTGRESREKYLLHADDVYPIARLAGALLPDDAKVFYAGERVYHLLALGLDVTMGMPIRQDIVDFPVIKTPAELLARLRRLGYTHLIADERLLASRTPFAYELLRPLQGRGLAPMAEEKGHVLYRIAPPGP